MPETVIYEYVTAILDLAVPPAKATCACCARGRSSQRPASRSGADESIARAPAAALGPLPFRDPGDGRPRAPRACSDHAELEDPTN